MNTKSLIVAIASLGLAASSYAQGTIAFGNSATTLVGTNGVVTSGGANSASGTKIELFYQPGGGSAPTALTVANFTSGSFGNWVAISANAGAVGTPLAGRFGSFSYTTSTDVAPAGSVWLQAIAWNGGSTSVSTAAAQATLAGVSTVWTQGTGDGNTIAPQTTPLFSGIVLQPIPEPSTIALAGLGAASLLLFRRK